MIALRSNIDCAPRFRGELLGNWRWKAIGSSATHSQHHFPIQETGKRVIGGHIWADPTIKLTHFGSHAHTGDAIRLYELSPMLDERPSEIAAGAAGGGCAG